MARIRTIKPGFWDDPKLSGLSRDARLVYIGLWTYADDYGVVKASVVWLKSHIFPYDDIDCKSFEAWIDELRGLDRIRPFTANDETYFYLTKFLSHQRIDRPSKTRNPQVPQSIVEHSTQCSEDSTRTRRALDDVLVLGEGLVKVGDVEATPEENVDKSKPPDPPPYFTGHDPSKTALNNFREWRRSDFAQYHIGVISALHGEQFVREQISDLDDWLGGRPDAIKSDWLSWLNSCVSRNHKEKRSKRARDVPISSEQETAHYEGHRRSGGSGFERITLEGLEK